MAAPYSVDLRQKILLALAEGGKSQREIAVLFHVSQTFVESLLRQVRATGRIEPKPAAGGPPPRLDEQARQRLREWLAEQPDLTLEELVERLQRECGIHVCVSLVCRVLQDLGLPRKKKTLHATEHDTNRVRQARQAYRNDIAGLPAERFKFIDESGANIAMTPTFGRAARGERVPDAVPNNHGDNITILGSLSWTGLEAVMTINGEPPRKSRRLQHLRKWSHEEEINKIFAGGHGACSAPGLREQGTVRVAVGGD
ncbi:MAG TPA: IS630 family transposase [Noviherbaspirillum sp.]